MTYTKPLPRPDDVDGPYWEALRSHSLQVQECMTCGARQWYPREFCSSCNGIALKWTEIANDGVVYSFTTQHQKTGSKFDDDIPYTVALVELRDAPDVRVLGVLIDSDAEPHVGMRVVGQFEDVTEEVTLLRFRSEGARS
jgi:uncharacterized OB-fold protein